MAEATSTILGEIKLVGDLAGNGGAQLGSNPQLTTLSGLTPGQYDVANVTVDSKGRVTAVSSATSADIAALIPDASTTTKGKVKVGSNLFINGSPTNGYTTADFGGVLITTTPTGLCPTATYTLQLTIDTNIRTFSALGTNLETAQEVITALNAQLGTYATATLTGGNIKITSLTTGTTSIVDITTDGLFACMSGYVSLTKVDGIAACELYAKTASLTDAGVVQIGSGITVTSGVISVTSGTIPIATTSIRGGVIVPVAGRLQVDGSGNISVPVATTSTVGVTSIGSGLAVDANGVVTYSTSALPIASTTVLGCVKDGSGISIAGDGTLSLDVASASKATESGVGVMQVGTGLDVDVNGIVSVDLSEVSLPMASPTTLGAIKIGNGLDIDGVGVVTVNPTEILAAGANAGCVSVGSNITLSSGTISVANATTSVKGVLSISAGTGLSIASGVLSGTDAAIGTKGVVQVGTNISVTGGVISVPDATTSVKGVVSIGTNLSVASGVLSVPNAAVGTKGVVSIGSNINVASGVISIPDATTSVKGVVQVGTGLSVASGVISASIPDATTSVKGVVQVGTNISVASGVISVATATTSVKGVVQVGTNIGVTGGVISIPDATNTIKGVVNSANSANISITTGSIDVGTNIPKLNAQNTFTQAQASSISTVTYAASWTPNLATSNIFTMTLTGNLSINNPTNMVPGTTTLFVLKQDGTGSHSVTWAGGYFKIPTTETGNISLTANSTSVVTIHCVSATELLTTISRGFI